MELDLLDGSDAAPADPAEAAGPHEGAHLTVDPKSYWIYTNTPDRQRTRRRHVSGIRLRGGPGPPGRLCVIRRRCRCRIACSSRRSSLLVARRRRRSASRRTAQTDRHPGGLGLGAQRDSAANAASLHDDDRAAGRRGDPRRRLRRQGLLGHQRRRRTSRTSSRRRKARPRT